MEYKINGAGDLFRKCGDEFRCLYRRRWVPSSPDVWALPVLKPVPQEQAELLIRDHFRPTAWEERIAFTVYFPKFELWHVVDTYPLNWLINHGIAYTLTEPGGWYGLGKDLPDGSCCFHVFPPVNP